MGGDCGHELRKLVIFSRDLTPRVEIVHRKVQLLGGFHGERCVRARFDEVERELRVGGALHVDLAKFAAQPVLGRVVHFVPTPCSGCI